MRRKPPAVFVAVAVLGLALSTLPVATADAALPPGGSFDDDNGNTHEGYIEAIAAAGITKGCNPPANDEFCPNDDVTRGEMAALLRRALKLGSTRTDFFSDDGRSVFEADINALARAGITRGCNPPANTRFCANADVERGEMAALIRRALNLRSTQRDYFSDDNGSTFEDDINALARAGITKGCNPPRNDRFCPDRGVSRAEIATFIARALGLSPVSVPSSGGSNPGSSGGNLSGAFWKADYENGSTSAWDKIAISGRGDSDVVRNIVHTGSYSNALTINAGNSKSGVRMVFKNADNSRESDDENIPNEAYYSAWYYIPHEFTADWNIIHEWKQQCGGTGCVLYAVSVRNDRNGNLTLVLGANVNSSGNWQNNTNRDWSSGVQVPVGRWFHLESFYKWDENQNGRVISWLDGRELWDISGVTTAFNWQHNSYSRQWIVANYASDTNPSEFTMYVDDAVVSYSRVGP